MKFQQIRNATIILEYGGKRFLVDPWLAKKEALPAFPYTNNTRRHPLVELPVSTDELLKDVDAVIVTHLHPDHFDDVAVELIPKNYPIFAKDEEEAQVIRDYGFTDVQVYTFEGVTFGDVTLKQTRALHGEGEKVVEFMHKLGITEKASGFVLTHADEQTVYVAGDTIWFDGVQEAIDKHNPDIIILNAGDAQWLEGGSIIMGTRDIYETYKATPNATIILSHFETVNHAQLTRKEAQAFLDEKGIADSFLVPADGESYTFSKKATV